MPLHLNLYHEVQRQKKQQAYDPLKISVLVMLVLGMGLASNYFLIKRGVDKVKDTLAAKQAEFDKLKPEADAAGKGELELTAQITLSELLIKRIEERFYWAPILEEVIRITPHEIQLIKYWGEIKEGPRRGSISLDGTAAGADPRKVADDYRSALAEKFSAKPKVATATFRRLDENNETVRLDGKVLPTVVFSIVLEFQIDSSEPP